jgi:signal transduction histidine kinase
MLSRSTIPNVDISNTWLHRWIYYLAAGFIFAATVLRSMLVFKDSPVLRLVMLFLGAGLILFIGANRLYPRQPKLTPILIALQAVLVFLLLLRTATDYFVILFTILGMQALQQLPRRYGWAFIGLGSGLTFITLFYSFGAFYALALALGVTAMSIFAGAFQLASRRAQKAWEENQSLASQLQEANHKLRIFVQKQEQLAGVRERQRMARELHDSITQTIFSMNLATQSAQLMLERNPRGVAEQLDRLDELARSALSEIQVLISRLAPERAAPGGFEAVLRKHLADRLRLENLAVDLQVQGDGRLEPSEEQGLFRIAQEALNNIVKHAGVNQATIRLQLDGQPCLEIEDLGAGFDPRQAGGGGQLGLDGMHERAAAIGWALQVESAAGRGTRIRVSKEMKGAQQA